LLPLLRHQQVEMEANVSQIAAAVVKAILSKL
jgi:hypothetical protein